ncbi:hypothetical protein BCR34DRAFT_567784 [Clohesyomyces aquaticus]|uniref:Uncharacterized protein n=1 Tax=Clohesyomyces aquaticus TaxID=1231657 RepID=A0A1Y1ZHW2_9PLEO|nr:hypothetical protein BCR34DRAFT_567784 [Clohesyomyces aquaticus]
MFQVLSPLFWAFWQNLLYFFLVSTILVTSCSTGAVPAYNLFAWCFTFQLTGFFLRGKDLAAREARISKAL